MTDKELLALYHKNESEAVRETVRLYLPYVKAIVKDKLSAFSREDIEETVSDIFIRFWRSVGKVDLSRGSVRAYLCVLAKSAALRKRQQLAQAPRREDNNMLEKLEAQTAPPDERSRLLSALEQLADADRQIILMKYYLGLTHKQIGKELHINAKAAQKRTERAVARLKQIMGGEEYEF